MLTLMVILFFVTIAGILANSIVVRYSALNSVRIVALLIVFLVSIPLVVLGLVGLFAPQFDSAVRMWSLGVIAAVAAFWLKSPFRNAREN